MHPQIVDRSTWLAARKALLVEERDLTRRHDRLRAQRQALPWVKVEKSYVFAAPDGPRTLADLFEGRSQLWVQHFMLAPGAQHICPGCACFAEHADVARRHFEHADLSFAAVSRASAEEIAAVKDRMGWSFTWVSCAENGFNHDFGAAFTPAEIADGAALYNYGTTPYLEEDMPANSVFARTADGEIFHTYSTYARGNDDLFFPFQFLDRTPNGRNEADGPMSWVRLRDEYAAPASAHRCRAAGA